MIPPYIFLTYNSTFKFDCNKFKNYYHRRFIYLVSHVKKLIKYLLNILLTKKR